MNDEEGCVDGYNGAGLTDGGIYKDDEQTGVIYPLDLKPATGIFELRKRRLYVACLELLWKTGQREDARDGGRKLRERGCHWVRTRTENARGKRWVMTGDAVGQAEEGRKD